MTAADYWNEVKRIQVSMRAASIYTAEATRIINGITGKYGYLFGVDSIYRATPIEEINRMLAEMKNKGSQYAEQAAIIEECYKNSGPFTAGEKLTQVEITAEKAKLDETIQRLEIEVAGQVKQREH
jgi:uncharacterized coiled-coil protein SlyX